MTTTKETKLRRVFDWFELKNIEFDYGELIEHDGDHLNQYTMLANWNDVSDKMGDYIQDTLEIDVNWSDEYSSCCECNKYFRISANCHGWSPNYINTEHGPVCRECLSSDIDYLIDVIKNTTDRAIPDWSIELVQKEGFICLDDSDEATYIFV